MGKVYKRKRRSCGLCKPHKTGWAPRFKDRQRGLQKVHESEMKAVLRTGV